MDTTDVGRASVSLVVHHLRGSSDLMVCIDDRFPEKETGKQ
ncbi:hypothetical protein VRK_28240 [Vibrio sp. MEBiC08052]|nr:hypothetical protein VRK_28240 [Vibrio sp. MEBiC08052]